VKHQDRELSSGTKTISFKNFGDLVSLITTMFVVESVESRQAEPTDRTLKTLKVTRIGLSQHRFFYEKNIYEL
jgi:hypothetical protein